MKKVAVISESQLDYSDFMKHINNRTPPEGQEDNTYYMILTPQAADGRRFDILAATISAHSNPQFKEIYELIYFSNKNNKDPEFFDAISDTRTLKNLNPPQKTAIIVDINSITMITQSGVYVSASKILDILEQKGVLIYDSSRGSAPVVVSGNPKVIVVESEEAQILLADKIKNR